MKKEKKKKINQNPGNCSKFSPCHQQHLPEAKTKKKKAQAQTTPSVSSLAVAANGEAKPCKAKKKKKGNEYLRRLTNFIKWQFNQSILTFSYFAILRSFVVHSFVHLFVGLFIPPLSSNI